MNETLKLKTDTFLRMEQELNRLQVSNAALLEAARKFHEWLEDVPGLKLDHKIGGNVEGCIGCYAIAKAEGRP